MTTADQNTESCKLKANMRNVSFVIALILSAEITLCIKKTALLLSVESYQLPVDANTIYHRYD